MDKSLTQAVTSSPRLELTERRRVAWTSLLRRRQVEVTRVALAIGAAAADAIAIIGTGIVTEAAYYSLAFNTPGPFGINVQVAFIVCIFIVLLNALRHEYVIENFLRWVPQVPRLSLVWAGAFILVLALGFLTKTTSEYSRALGLMFFVSGWAALLGTRFILVRFLSRRSSIGADSVRRVVVIGYPEDVEAFQETYKSDEIGCRIVGYSYLRRDPNSNEHANRATELDEDIALSISTVRLLRPDDVFILMPWSDVEGLDRCVKAFMNVPVSLHLRPELVMARFGDMSVGRVGQLLGSTLHASRLR